MDHFHYQDRTLYCEDVPVPTLAQVYGTPLYVYSQQTLLHHLEQLQQAFQPANPLICYSLKTNPNLSIARLMEGATESLRAFCLAPAGADDFLDRDRRSN